MPTTAEYANLTPGTPEYSAAVLQHFQTLLARRRAASLEGLGERFGSRGQLYSGGLLEAEGGLNLAALGEEQGKMLELAGMEGAYRTKFEQDRLARAHEERLLRLKDELDRRREEATSARLRRQRALQGAASGAGTGAAIGSAFPGYGTVIGAGIGAIGGGLAGYYS